MSARATAPKTPKAKKPKVVSTWLVDGTMYRIVGVLGPPNRPNAKLSINNFVLERCERDAAGGERWVRVPLEGCETERALVAGVVANALDIADND